MKNWKILLPAALLLSTLWFACRDQDYDGYEKQADVAFAGRVVDEAGQPIEGAQVRAGAELAITDENGVFRTKPVSFPASDAKLSVTKIGYFEFSRAFIVKDDALQTVTIQLLEKELVGTFNGNTGGTVQVPGGVSLHFPAGAVSATGQVRVFAKYLDPTSSTLALQMPGDLRAISTGGEEGTLATFGMLGVELTDASGQVLQIASGNEVEITMPIQASQLSVAPATIALWYYDHDQARWIEEGSAQKVGSQYVGKVKHFSFWNCDAFSATIYMDGKVFLRDNQHPLANAVVRLTVLFNGFQGFGYTNADGGFGGAVPKDYAMKLEILLPDQCGGQVIYSQDIGPFANDATLPPIILTNLPPQTPELFVSGTLEDCNGQPLADGYVKVQIGDNVFTVFANQDGEFEVNAINCDINASGSAIGYDLTNLLESPVENFNATSNPIDLGSIAVCNALSEYIQYTLDGQNFTLIDITGNLANNAPGSTQVFLNSLDSLPTIGIGMVFGNNNNQLGTFPMLVFNVNGLETHSDQAANISTTLTSTGNIGDPFIGTFGGSFQATNGTNHTISGSYRVLRDQ